MFDVTIQHSITSILSSSVSLARVYRNILVTAFRFFVFGFRFSVSGFGFVGPSFR